MNQRSFLIFLLCMFIFPLYAADNQSLVLKKVTNNTWSIVGPLTDRTRENLGNNATFGFIVTDEGIVVIDSGGSLEGAKLIHQLVKSVSNKPIRYVINTGGQDHRWFGNDYFSTLGAKIISSTAARQDHKARLNTQWARMETGIGKKGIKGTREKFADIVFNDEYKFKLGNTDFEIYFRGQAHTPGDAFIWLPQSKVMFTGDIVYTERMLGIGEQSKSKTWLAAFDAMAAFKPVHVVPGHGSPTTLKIAIRDSRDYIAYLRQSIAAFIEQGGDASEISKVNQSRFKYLKNSELLSGRNALKVYTELEWE